MHSQAQQLNDLRARAVAQRAAVRGEEPSQESQRRGAIVEEIIDLQVRLAESAPILNTEIDAIEQKLDATDEASYRAFVAMEEERYAVKIAERTQPGNAVLTTARAKPSKKYPERAAWLREQMRKRGWSNHGLEAHGGPNHETTERILQGFPAQHRVHQKIADGLSQKLRKVEAREIPNA